jgi:hypothetical protein
MIHARATLLVLLLAAKSVFAQASETSEARPDWPPGGPGIERLLRMSPEERGKLLDRLPPWRRQRLEERLERYRQLSPEERQRMAERYGVFRKMPPRKQAEMRHLYRRLSELPEERRLELRWQARRLSMMPPERRQARMSSPRFRRRYTPAERELLADMVRVLPLAR